MDREKLLQPKVGAFLILPRLPKRRANGQVPAVPACAHQAKRRKLLTAPLGA